MSFSPNTLFNYFPKITPTNKNPSKELNTSGPANAEASFTKEKCGNKKRGRRSPDSEVRSSSKEDSILLSKKSKRLRLIIEDDDAKTENRTDNSMGIPEQKTELLNTFKYKEVLLAPPNTPQISDPSGSSPSLKSVTTPLELETALALQEPAPIAADEDWMHCKLNFLKPDKIMDANMKSPDHPDYDPSTLHVPSKFMKEQTPAHRQWWAMKSKHYDCVLFFKVGKFYELYHMDAAVGVNELGFSYMKGEFAHSGFPESAYARMASTLVSKGYKVARVEQTETPEMMQERCQKTGRNTKFDKVVRREICQVTMRGTQTCGMQDPGPSEAESNYMVAVAEQEGQNSSIYGVCFVDTSIGLFHIGQFEDDKHSSRLLTTLAHYPPALIVYDRKSTSARTVKLISSHCPSARREPLALWTPEKTLKTLAEKYYKVADDGEWPEGIKPFLHEGDVLGLTPATNCDMAIKALSGCVAFLTECLLDLQILGMAQFTSYAPPDVLNQTLSQEEKSQSQTKWEGSSTMVLDAITLRNLRIVQDEGCLYDRLNFCTTAMGKRLLYQWVCAPSSNLNIIKERQEAVQSLYQNLELCQEAKKLLTTLPDLERLLAKVHSFGSSLCAKQHPDSRAIFYEEKIYSKRKVLDFISVLNGLASALKMVELFDNVEAVLLKKIMQLPPKGKFPDYQNTLKFFKESFNQEDAEKEGRILPEGGVDDDYDNILGIIEEIQDDLKCYLKDQERYFKCKLAYVGTDKKRYQIEVPIAATNKIDDRYQMTSARKGFKRYTTEETREFLARMQDAEDKKSVILLDLSRRVFEKFSSHYNEWEAAVQCVATLDILLAFAEFARQQTCDVCLPNITHDADKKPYIHISEGRHPCISITNFIPNDTHLGEESTFLLLTGPNMGGKSTLMRQVGLLTVLAHLGSYVPAVECSMSVVDRVFTRLGASDDILSGQSTFHVEMDETASIVKHATSHSLVLLDELGRGTSTYDGTAIASAICVELAGKRCRCLFSTHYHSLVSDLDKHPAVQLGHMACMVETVEVTDGVPEERITFLYKLTPGACPKSYGFNAARLAGVPREIVCRANLISKRLEKVVICLRLIRDIMASKSKKNVHPNQIRSLLAIANQ